MSFSFKRGKSSWVLAGLVGGVVLWSAVETGMMIDPNGWHLTEAGMLIDPNGFRPAAADRSMSIDPDGRC